MMTLPFKPAIFMHIQKTAGTTLVNLVRSTYGNDNIISHGDYLHGINHSPMKCHFMVNNQALADFYCVPFLSGHFGYDFTKRYMEGRYSFTFLRDPVERVLSFYYYCRNQKPDLFEIYKICQSMTLDEFLNAGLVESDVRSFIWNNQVWQLACGFGNLDNHGISSFHPRELLDLAVKHIKRFSYVGFAETFEKDRDVILENLGIGIPQGTVVVNANPGRPMYHDLPLPTKMLLLEMTELDRELYAKVWSDKASVSKGQLCNG
jgi:hypothetical protein